MVHVVCRCRDTWRARFAGSDHYPRGIMNERILASSQLEPPPADTPERTVKTPFLENR